MVRYSSIFAELSEIRKIQLTSWLCEEAKMTGLSIKLPSGFEKYNLLIGDNEDISEEELAQRKLVKRDEYITGEYHQRTGKMALKTKPKFSFDILAKAKGIYYQDITDTNRNDCLIYAINYACRT